MHPDPASADASWLLPACCVGPPAGCTLRTYDDDERWARVIGHDLTLHETNSRAAVAVCQCGWVGVVHAACRYRRPGTTRIVVRREHAEDAARAEHARHLLDVRADIAQRSDAELARIGRLIPMTNATLRRRGRWGNP